jgi:hypothetical protein
MTSTKSIQLVQSVQPPSLLGEDNFRLGVFPVFIVCFSSARSNEQRNEALEQLDMN